MANHKSALKRIRQDRKTFENRYWAKTMRNSIKKQDLLIAAELKAKCRK